MEESHKSNDESSVAHKKYHPCAFWDYSSHIKEFFFLPSLDSKFLLR